MLLMLISEIESPDSRQFMTELYEDFGRLMYHTAKQLIDEPEGQEDVVQDALIGTVSAGRTALLIFVEDEVFLDANFAGPPLPVLWKRWYLCKIGVPFVCLQLVTAFQFLFADILLKSQDCIVSTVSP